MSIEAYIKNEILQSRLAESSVLVVYDKELRYRKLCAEMVSDSCTVIDVSVGSLATRQQGIKALSHLTAGQQLLVYIPKHAPLEEEEKQKDPFAVYAVAGSVFPDPERSGDNFIDICLKSKPDQATEIRALFEKNSQPSFDVINAIGGGANWSTLQAILVAEGAVNLLFKLMVADAKMQTKLAEQDSWLVEVQSLFSSVLGMTLRTKQSNCTAVIDELWRFVLFSEFVFDLNEAIPAGLIDVPTAKESARPIVEELGDNLRKHTDYKILYIEQAEAIEQELNLDTVCAKILKLGRRDTFPFEEYCYLKQAISALLTGDGDSTRTFIKEHANSVWSEKSDSQANWDLVKSAQQLMETCDDLQRELGAYTKSPEILIEAYQTSLRKADQLHREFEQAVNDCPDVEELMPGGVDQVRKVYRNLVESVQFKFTSFVDNTGWPLQGVISNTQVFDTKVAPILKNSGSRVAYMMVDALRYELGYELHKQLSEDADTSLSVAFATLPSITPVGMASLLPDASQKLSVSLVEGKTKALFDGNAISDVPSRMKVFSSRYGDRFQEMELHAFVKARKKIDVSTELLVLRSTEIDSYFENHAEDAPYMIQRELKLIRRAVNKLQSQGFQKVIIATDHGFYMNNAQEAGDLVSKPEGDWKVEHERMLLGNGNVDAHHYKLSAEQCGIKTDIPQFSGPRSLAPYRRGMLYYHGGLSLQECLLPVIEITLKSTIVKAKQTATVLLDYKKGAKRVTARFAVIELKLEGLQKGMFDDIDETGAVEILLEAHKGAKGTTVVGEAKPGQYVNAATGTILVEPGESIKVTLKMDPEFEGKFTVKAIDPLTSTVLGIPLELETDYAV
ncbi:hypothetical protein BHECKSOX_2126 [Bathymodiolus heckerae thiotrophic gill symbiont]|uniref:PglZ domain-containing protein n=1 Tax=Bathymodiolus heckerae thiotrophic gill symbiont TaxID=1052212 RepID=UPI0010BB7849|nr:PglZ domain-containing protein [Bathymodiolus heckerae thiotrophic gill symbiont]SHN91739.1 hypothetical protein BHECKSOX_2126 [Bathymodiolus heckerae thiotrophic gill symbiont]